MRHFKKIQRPFSPQEATHSLKVLDNNIDSTPTASFLSPIITDYLPNIALKLNRFGTLRNRAMRLCEQDNGLICFPCLYCAERQFNGKDGFLLGCAQQQKMEVKIAEPSIDC
eukprot:TRINITY_DN14449_c0_g1_i1.p1 TRINITY_DN14449_c0_g1~~TRINITY_DN14449_c0_g1_i1.p1  ORF type:complete len:112 (+),score=13.41 TRINITY_DN14449_c0_g1_i1:86-421(+)